MWYCLALANIERPNANILRVKVTSNIYTNQTPPQCTPNPLIVPTTHRSALPSTLDPDLVKWCPKAILSCSSTPSLTWSNR